MARLSFRRYLLVSAFLFLAVFSAAASAQNNNNNNNNNGGNDNNGNTPSSTTAAQTSTNTGDNAQSTDTNTSPSQTDSGTSQSSNPTSTAGQTTAVITPTGTDGGGNTDNGPRPTISSSSNGEDSAAPKLTGLPTLTRTKQTIPTYPPPSPPPTNNAPYMQRSTLPSGTVFIVVGAILGAFGATILIWRAIVACMLHRSVKRAAMAQYAANDKTPFPQPPAPFYKYSDRDSSPNLAGMAGAGGRGVRRTHRGPTPSATPSQTNLFFSPTAPGASTSGLVGGDRSSRYLPSGFYAAGSAAASGHGQSISMSNLRPDSRGHVRAVGPSPPDSPAVGPVAMPRTTPVPRNMSSSTVNLNRPPSGRAPSAYLDDLLDDPNSGFPPGGQFPPVPHHHQANRSQSSLGRLGDR